MRLNGIHHVTCFTADTARNLDFYTRVLGLRLVKKTVNQDDVGVYHLFYADETGAAGSAMTFFEASGASPGVAGTGMVHTIVSRVASSDALRFWEARLGGEGVKTSHHGNGLGFRDPDGLQHQLVPAPQTGDEPLVAVHTEIAPEQALQGLDGVRVYAQDPAAGSDFLATALGFEEASEPGVWRVAGETRSALYTRQQPPRDRGRPGPGTVHHVAFSTTLGEEDGWHARLSEAGASPSPVIDRFWFRSIYFREPGGVLFELATDGPGFTADESLDRLGEKLTLPSVIRADAGENRGCADSPAIAPRVAPASLSRVSHLQASSWAHARPCRRGRTEDGQTHPPRTHGRGLRSRRGLERRRRHLAGWRHRV